jgi:hypothetical protein
MLAGDPLTSSLSRNDVLWPGPGLSSFDMSSNALYDKPRFKLCKRRAYVAEDGGNGCSYVPDPGDASQRNETNEQGIFHQILAPFVALQGL